MDKPILGLHHVTAIANQAKINLDFYTQILGVRLVKKTVNFDDPGTYHFYFGNEVGEAGTILTFFPWEGIGQGTNGAGLATHIGYSVSKGALAFWKKRLTHFGIDYREEEHFAEQQISFTDPDGLQLELIEVASQDERKGWTTEEIKEEMAIKGLHKVTLTLNTVSATAQVLTDLLGYQLQSKEDNRYRYITDAVAHAHIIDIIEDPTLPMGYNAAGTNHHVAFRVQDDKVLMEMRAQILAAGFNVTPKIDRDYFYSLYFREPGGILFEIATENPGFTVDEPIDELGNKLKLPSQLEAMRSEIEAVLPKLD